MMSDAQKFVKKPVEIEAMQFDGSKESSDQILEWINGNGGKAREYFSSDESKRGILIDTLEGGMTGSLGDWIIQGVEGEFYPCKPAIFEKTYNPSKEKNFLPLRIGENVLGKIHFDTETREIEGKLFDNGFAELLKDSFEKDLLEVSFLGRPAKPGRNVQEKFTTWIRDHSDNKGI
jgi:hypothetical protein